MPLHLALTIAHPVFAPGEAIYPIVSLSNSEADAGEAPALDGRGHSAILLSLTVPGGETSEFTLPSDLGRSPAAGGNWAPLAPGATIWRRFALPDTSAPGAYRLSARVEHARGESLTANPVEWTREAPDAIAPILPVYRGALNASRHDCYFFFQGKQLSALFSCHLLLDDYNFTPSLRPGPVERVLDVSPAAHSLSVVSGIAGPPHIGEDWIAWLDSDGLHAGIYLYGFQHALCPVPFPAARILSHTVAEDGAGCDVLILGRDTLSLALIRFDRPALAPSTETALPEEEDEDDTLYPVSFPPPRIVWTHSHPQAILTAALARAPGELSHRSALAIFTTQAEGIDITFFPLESDGPPATSGFMFIAGKPLPGDYAPAFLLDIQAKGHVALLVSTVSEEGQTQVVLARTSFSQDGRPRLDRGVVYHETAPLEAEPIRSLVSLYPNDDGGPWSIDWCVIFPGGQVLASNRLGPAKLRSVTAGLAHTHLYGFAERTHLAAHRDGKPAFIDIG
jgi:hypothetical protein